MKKTLQQRAQALGVADAYWDVDGHYHPIDEAILTYFIESLMRQDTAIQSSRQNNRFDRVKVLPVNSKQTLPLDVVVSEYRLVDERQVIVEQTQKNSLQALSLPALDSGYYTLEMVDVNGNFQRWRLLVAPSTCYQPNILEKHQLRGLMLQLYSLRSDARHDVKNNDQLLQNWGIGDFADLYNAVAVAAEQHFDFIGLNPMHALFPSQPQWVSPYSPSSRRWLHWIYLSIEWIPEFTDSADNLTWLAERQQQLEALRQAPLVDYVGVSKLKMQALRLAFRHFEKNRNTKRHADFDQFVNQGGEALLGNSTFYAISETVSSSHLGGMMGYWDFPEALRTIHSPGVKRFVAEHQDAIRFYSYIQWLLDEQLSAVQQHCLDSGLIIGLYGDLAVGAARGAADIWQSPELYGLSASIGAPPDPLGPVGQNWDLPPMHPRVLEEQGLQAFIEIIRANMKHCGALRIDHVMGLYRLWLIPEGKAASHGTYVHYPFEALMAVLAIESQRAKCLVIGEDLGTVPDQVRQYLDRYRVLSYDVLYFAGRVTDNEQQRWRCPSAVNRGSLGVVGTHDLPPLAGWWHCSDLALLGHLSILDEQDLKSLYDVRLYDKQALLNALKSDGYLPDNYQGDALTMAMHQRLNQAIHAYAGDGRTCLFGLQPENFCPVEAAFNVPGTTDEVPNWRRKLPCPLSQIAFDF